MTNQVFFCEFCKDPISNKNTIHTICKEIIVARALVTVKAAVGTGAYFCVYTNKQITGEYCTDCNRLDCAVTSEELSDILS